MIPTVIQGLIITGACEVIRQAGGYAISVVGKNLELSPLVIGTQFLATKAQMAHLNKVSEGIKREINTGFQETNGKLEDIHNDIENLQNLISKFNVENFQGLLSLQASVAALQTSTAVLGVGMAAGIALSAVNLWQVLKLREDVKLLKSEVRDGFLDLKQVFKDQGNEIIELINQVAKDVEFGQHRSILAQAYGRFVQANNRIKIAMSSENQSIRDSDLANARQTLDLALADYNNPRLFSENNAAGQLRRIECSWAIEQTIALTYQWQNQLSAAKAQLSHLQNKVIQDILKVIDSCKTRDELDFIFPELTRIHNQDLAILKSWQDYLDWLSSLPSSDLELLKDAKFIHRKTINLLENTSSDIALSEPPEQSLYENLKQKSHPNSLLNQLQFLFKPELRREYESYVSQQAAIAGYKSLVPTHLQQASDLAVANLYWYFKVRDESETEAALA